MVLPFQGSGFFGGSNPGLAPRAGVTGMGQDLLPERR